MFRLALAVGLAAVLARPVAAQQRPLVTEDPETVGEGRLLVEGGIDYARDQQYPATGLEGTLWRIPRIGVSVGVSSIAEIQLDGGFYNRLAIDKRVQAPLSDSLLFSGTSTSDVEDFVMAAKIRIAGETARRPAFGFRFATRLPNASIQNGIGTDTTDFFASALAAKTVQSVRVVGNIGLGILGDPTNGHRQNDVLTYGGSFARALTEQAEVVGEVNGRVSTRSGAAFPGTETRGTLTLGGRYTRGALRLDAAMFFGLTSVDPTVGFSTGFTYVFHAFDVP
jgi:hypothetical protein